MRTLLSHDFVGVTEALFPRVPESHRSKIHIIINISHVRITEQKMKALEK